MQKLILFIVLITSFLSACSSEFNKQLELAKKEKCALLSKLEQLKKDSTNLTLREEIYSMERMLDTHKELSGNSEKFTQELKNYNCK